MGESMEIRNVANVRCEIKASYVGTASTIIDYKCAVDERIETLEGDDIRTTVITTNKIFIETDVLEHQNFIDNRLMMRFKRFTGYITCTLHDYTKLSEYKRLYTVDKLVCFKG